MRGGSAEVAIYREELLRKIRARTPMRPDRRSELSLRLTSAAISRFAASSASRCWRTSALTCIGLYLSPGSTATTGTIRPTQRTFSYNTRLVRSACNPAQRRIQRSPELVDFHRRRHFRSNVPRRCRDRDAAGLAASWDFWLIAEGVMGRVTSGSAVRGMREARSAP